MEIVKIMELSGPNIWTNRYVLEAWVDLGSYEEKPSNVIPGFNERLTAMLPSLIEHRCSVGERGGFLSRLRDGTWLGHILEHVSLELQTLVYVPVGYGRARETTDYGVYRVVIATMEPELGRASLATARRLLLSVAEQTDFDFEQELGELKQLAERVGLSSFGRVLLLAARERGVPFRRLGELVLLGYGVEQKRVHGNHTDVTSALGATLVEDVELSRELLRQVGVRVLPEGEKSTLPRHAIWVVGERVVGVFSDLTSSAAPRFSEAFHPDVAQLALLSARTLGLQVALVELAVKDINLPLDRQQASVVRVDSKLDWDAAVKLGFPSAVKLAGALLEELMPASDAGRFRLVAVSGTNGKTDVAARVHALLASNGARVGTADQHADLVEGTLTNAGIQRLLMNPLLDAAVIEVSEIGVLERGAPFDYATLAIVTNLGEGDHLGRQYLETRDLAKKAIRTPVDIVRADGFSVLNYDDVEVRDLAKHSAGRVLFFTTGEPDFSVRVEEREVPGWCYVAGGKVWAGWSREAALAILEGTQLPSAGWQLQNVLAALASGWLLGMPQEALQKAAVLEDQSVVKVQITTGCPMWLASARNSEALGAWLSEAAADTPRERIGLVLNVAADWRVLDATAIAVQCQGLGAVALVLDANSGSVGKERAEQIQAALTPATSNVGIWPSVGAAIESLTATGTSKGLQKILVQTRGRSETSALAGQLRA